MVPPIPEDRLGRPLRKLRLSVTDRCNFRCRYCMPETEYSWLPRAALLEFEELRRIAAVFLRVGVSEIRLTGGEPLLRRDLPVLVRMLSGLEGLRDLAMTTNGARLPELAGELARAGLRRVTISLDSLDPERFRRITQKDVLPEVLEGVEAARRAGFAEVKLNCVVMRGINDDEIPDLLDFALEWGLEPRFIEYMDVGGATRWDGAEVFPKEEILARITKRFGPPRPLEGRGSAPAQRYRLPNGAVFGLIASTTAPFCRGCDRSRLSADGHWFHCLYAATGIDLRGLLRGGAEDGILEERIRGAWGERRDRGAEDRFGLADRRPLLDAAAMRAHPHLEMHKRGG